MTAALAKTLLHFLWEGTVLALVLALAMRSAKSARVRYAMSCGALLAMPAAFLATLFKLTPYSAAPLTGDLGFPLRQVVVHGALPVSQTPVRDPSQWLVLAWSLGVCALFLYKLMGWVGTQRLRRVGVCVATGDWQNRLARLAALMHITRPVALLESCLTD